MSDEMMEALGLAQGFLAGAAGGFFAVLVYAGYLHQWLPYWPFGVVPLFCFCASFTLFMVRKQERDDRGDA